MNPRWIPLNARGTHWQFFSHKGRKLGYVIHVECSDGKPWCARRECCGAFQDFSTMREAARFVLKTLECYECAQKVNKAALDWYQN